ncbi:MAG: YegS/Rv2252/BmrU family lipid kinase [Defluviitaleaceae bacterium]|nr:YegS/Rv2252/BmrU family lipid kinase [Defluviitaleaceae bacterium]
MKEDFYIIYNSYAKRGNSKHYLNAITSILNTTEEKYCLKPTEHRGHAADLMRQIIAKGGKQIIIIGGDGTIHEAANGTTPNDDVVLGIIPAGTGNDVATMLGLPFGVENVSVCMQNILARSIKSIDIMTEQNSGRRSVLFFSYGIAANMVMTMEKYTKKSKLSYYRALIKHMFGYKAATYQIVINENDKRTVTADFLGLHNCIHAGGGMRLVHNAIIDDGLAEVFIVHYKGLLRRIANLIAIASGNAHKQPNIEIIKATTLTINSPNNNLCCSDGEIILTNQLDIKLTHKGIKIFGGKCGK